MILIVSILIAGGLTVSVNKINNIKAETSQKRINDIYKALGAYLLANKALPCPAVITESRVSSLVYGRGKCDKIGVYTSTDNANLVYGMVPVKDLDLSSDVAEDGFGSKFAYVVDKRFTVPGPSGFGADYGDSQFMTIKEVTSAGEDYTDITNKAIFLIISYGANKSGAFNTNSNTQNTASSDNKEKANYAVPVTTQTATLGNTFYHSVKFGEVFDDTVFYKTRNALVSDFNAFDSIGCPSGKTESLYGGAIIWPEGKYGQVVAASTQCPVGYRATVKYPTKKCGAYGLWEDGVINPCSQNW